MPGARCTRSAVRVVDAVLQEPVLAGSSTMLLAGTHTALGGRLWLFCVWGSLISRSDAERMLPVRVLKLI